jgi:dTDP-4-dehydrorhamnose reductase
VTRVLVLGRFGQLARALAATPWPDGWTPAFAGRETLDLTRPEGIAPLLADQAPDLVINTAAFTAVDAAETDVPAAYALNADAPQALAEACLDQGRALIHLSTDYVFSGDGGAPHAEDAPTAPLNVYGRSKADGEQRVMAANPDALVVRTAWLLSPRSGFVRAILSRATAGAPLRVVSDQRGNPTRASDLAAALADIAGKKLSGVGSGGLLHAAGQDPATWFDLGEALALAAGRPAGSVQAIDSETHNSVAVRPRDSRLDVTRLKSVYGITLPGWTAWITETAQLGLIGAANGVETRQQSGG